jgi:hypothetical protein
MMPTILVSAAVLLLGADDAPSKVNAAPSKVNAAPSKMNAAPSQVNAPPFKIHVVDADTGRGVPLVELETVGHVRYYTDSAGVVALDEPSLLDRDVYFYVRSHGYEFRKDGFGFAGKRLDVTSGGEATLEIKRNNIAERMYRVTGEGIYRDTVLLGAKPPIARPLLNAKVIGSDSAVNALFGGRVVWFWGDTNRARYPLGNFHVPGAVSSLPDDGGLDIDVGIDLEYFTDDDGFVRSTCEMPGDGPTWIDGLMTVTGATGDERMFAKYVKVRKPLVIYQRGLVEFNAETDRFEKQFEFAEDAPIVPAGHPFAHDTDGERYVYFGREYPLMRVKATADAVVDPASYEAYTYFTSGSRGDEYPLARDVEGRLDWAWRRDTLAPTENLEKQLIAAGLLSEDEAYFVLRDVDAGKHVTVHSSSVAWNEYRQRWVMIALEAFGTSVLGEVWFAEAAEPTGPWTVARKIVTHDRYSFYNPKQHAMFAKEGGRVIYFEGTYSHTFSGNPVATPRYDYNQIMYRLDLSDPRLAEEVFGQTAP